MAYVAPHYGNLVKRAKALGLIITKTTTNEDARIYGGHSYVLHAVGADWENMETVQLGGIRYEIEQLETAAAENAAKAVAVAHIHPNNPIEFANCIIMQVIEDAKGKRSGEIRKADNGDFIATRYRNVFGQRSTDTFTHYWQAVVFAGGGKAGAGVAMDSKITKESFADKQVWEGKVAALKVPLTYGVTMPVDVDKIHNAIVGAFEGGSNYWLQDAIFKSGTPHKTMGLVWYGEKSVFETPFTFEVRFDDPNGDEGNGIGRKVITHTDILQGLAIMSVQEPSHFADLMSERDDAGTHDVFMQFVVLGEIIYG